MSDMAESDWSLNRIEIWDGSKWGMRRNVMKVFFYWLPLFRLHNATFYYSSGDAHFTELVALISTNDFFSSFFFFLEYTHYVSKENHTYSVYSCLLWVLWFLVLITILKSATSHQRNGALNVKCSAFFRQFKFLFSFRFPLNDCFLISFRTTWMFQSLAPSILVTGSKASSSFLLVQTFLTLQCYLLFYPK